MAKQPHQLLFHHIHKRGLDKLAYVMIGISLLTVIPQIVQIYETQSAEDINIYSYIGHIGISIFWLWFGVERKVKPVILSSLVHFGISLLVIHGIVKFGNVPFL